MRSPFGRTPRRDPRVEQALRNSLTEHARQAPAGHDMTERVLAAVDRTPARDPRHDHPRWRTWALPLIAAGAVAAVVGAVAGLQELDKPSAHGRAAASPSATVRPSHSVTPTPSTATTRAPSAHSSRPATKPPVDTSTLHGVKVVDLTFADTDDGWALATADCINGSGRCPAVLRTHDGTHWGSANIVDFNVPGQTGGCSGRCVEHLRFGTDEIGYAYGPKTLLMTTDGGQSWVPQTGGALFLETLKGNVIRVTSPHPGCPGPCDIEVQTAPLGSDTWTTVLGPLNSTGGLQFARGGDDAYLLVTANPAGGAENETSTLYRSADDGATWHQGGEPCPQLDREDDSSAIAAGDDGRAAVLCTPRGKVSDQFVATSTDHGAHFTAQPGRIPNYADQLTGDPATVLLATYRGAARSTDGGRSWSAVRYPFGRVTFAGFENPQVGRIVGAGGTEIWTTRDGGATWAKVVFR